MKNGPDDYVTPDIVDIVFGSALGMCCAFHLIRSPYRIPTEIIFQLELILVLDFFEGRAVTNT